MADANDPSFFGENRSLFSDYYIAERLQDHKEWSADVSEPFQKALEIYQENKALLPEMKEAQTEKEFIQPILSEVLGFEYDVQRSEKRSGRVNIPDYILFGNRSALKEAQAHRNEAGKYYSDALALSDAKYWERPLDGTGVAEKDRLTNANPSFQIVSYLTVTGLDWGILTNGSHWRLYSMKSRSRIDSYFEVNLKRILEEEDEEQFKYFYHFFRAEAFRKDPETVQHFLGSVFSGSIDYGTRLEGRLKELIFEDVFLTLAKGFTEFRADEARNEEETDQSLQKIYQGTLRLLYRLLFLLHAESRGLLPVDEPKGYYQHSLMKLKREIAHKMDSGEKLSTASNNIWNDLVGLFRIIDRGDAALNVPRYNGGLFRNDHPKNDFLNNHAMVDQHIVPALELLTREPDPKTGRKRFIDYKSLNVEQLGSIYEGLLEFHLRIAGEPLAIVKEKGREVYKPQSEVKNPSAVLEQGELYLENDKGERKATGSYYTPHYIVEYIVEHTLGPVFDERAKTFEDFMDRLEPKYGAYSKLNQKIADGDRSERTHNKRKEVNLEMESLENRATEALLSIKICDPAMGSGHFLKEATDKLAEKIITLLAQYPLNPVTKLLGSVREDILASLDEQDITIDAEEHLKDTNLIKRMVMKRSIYGVDLNPMAVELAKLSLWLDSFTVGAPLSFLDHHLKTGNSLIGTTVKEVKHTLELDEDRQIEAFGGPFSALLTATQLMRDVAQRTDATISEVQQSVETYHDYEEAITPYKRLLDLWISRHFDNDKALVLLRQYPDKIIKEVRGEESDLHENYVPVLEQAEAQADSKRFFHWELEFPEVFIDLKQSQWLENPGFDAVVGNPPYLISAGKDDKNYFKSFQLSEYQTDQYVYFIEKSLLVCKSSGYISQIVPDSWLNSKYFKKLRENFVTQNELSDIVIFDHLVFEDVTLENSIFILSKDGMKEQDIKITLMDKYGQTEQKVLIPRKHLSPGDIIKVNFDQHIHEILESIKLNSIDFGEIVQTNRGLHAYRTDGYGESKFQDGHQIKRDKEEESYHSDHRLDETYFMELRGKNIFRYIYKETDKWISYGTWLAEPREWKYFTGDRLAIRKVLGQTPIATILTDDLVLDQSLYIALKQENNYSNLYLLSLVNSNLVGFFIKFEFEIFDSVYPWFTHDQLRELPIREMDFSKFDPDKNTEYPDRLKQGYQQYLDETAAKDELLSLTETLVNDKEVYRLPVIHDFLAFLAEQMLEFNENKQKLKAALNPFKFLNRGVGFKKFSEVFSEAIKYGQQLTDSVDIGTVHHDIEGLRLQPEGDKWLLKLQIKHRDPETDWSDWIKEDGNIVRSTQPVYRFELPENQARYWQQAFEVLEEFENSSTFPGGKTRTTHEKLMKTKVPVFDESANIQPLIELREELAEVEVKIEKTDWLIDQVVYQLYGLSEEEIETVEGSGKK